MTEEVKVPALGLPQDEHARVALAHIAIKCLGLLGAAEHDHGPLFIAHLNIIINMKTILALSLLIAISTQASSPSTIVLKINENKRVELEPYKLYEVHVPLSSLQAEESYWLRTYFSGAVSPLTLTLSLARKRHRHEAQIG